MQKKVLIVEDEPLVARMYQKSLEASGYTAILAMGGEDGLEKIENEKPDLVLLDIMMPEPNGIEVLKKLKSNESTKKIPVVMMSNLSGKHDAELALSKGALDYWVKKDSDVSKIGNMIGEVIADGAKNAASTPPPQKDSI